MKNILTVFAGRKQNLEILIKYLKKALELKILDEIHFWNYTRNSNDEQYLKTISNLKRTSSKSNNEYIQIFTPVIDNSFTFEITDSNKVFIKIHNEKQNIYYEIVLNELDNNLNLVQCSITKNNNNELCSLSQSSINITDNSDNFDKKTITVCICENNLIVFLNKQKFIICEIKENITIDNICIKTGNNSFGNITYETIQNHHFYFMDTCEKSWKNYYNYYDNVIFKDDVIIKCDDDIVFIDLNKLPQFIDFIKNKGDDYDLIYANTINNNVSAYFQQNKYELIPKDLMILEYPPEGRCGTLWESGEKAEILHNYFIENYQNFLNYDYNNAIIEINTRFSINFIGYKGNKWCKIKDTCLHNNDDEYNLTVDYVKNRGFKNVLYTDFYVSHLSFFSQTHAMNIDDLISKYSVLYSKIH
jgi:hypothetical protein